MNRSIKALLAVSILLIITVDATHAQSSRGNRRGNINDYLVHSDEGQDIMGRNFYGLRELERILKTKLPRREIDQSYYVPFLKSTLERCRNCILFFYSPRFGVKSWGSSIRSFLFSRIRWIKKSFASNRRVAWWRDQRFAKQTLKSGWRLIRTEIDGNPANILNGRYRLGARERIAPALLYVYAMLLSPRSFDGKYIMTSSNTDQRRNMVIVGESRGRIIIDSLLIRPNTGWAVEIKPDRQGRGRGR